MSKINLANIKKTIYYFQRNGLKNTWYAARERLSSRQAAPYVYVCPSEEELVKQREWTKNFSEKERIFFSIVVPTYRTPRAYLRELVFSVVAQTYDQWELILADATEDDSVKQVMDSLVQELSSQSDGDLVPGIRYVKLEENAGISENTNRALQYAKGTYVCLLDHDDLLTPNALYEMALPIAENLESGITLQMVYSDEDKCDGEAKKFFDPHIKTDFNLDLLLSNNYICHFLALKRELIQKLGFRREYDGAQDYDLVLRVVSELDVLKNRQGEALIAHVPKVLYHWRCHLASTAENPRSKEYAYQAGLRALQDFADRENLQATAKHLKHLGFYRLDYHPVEVQGGKLGNAVPLGCLLACRTDVGMVCGALVCHGKIVSGPLDGTGKCLYHRLSVHESGYMHRAALTQDVAGADLRVCAFGSQLKELCESIGTGEWKEKEGAWYYQPTPGEKEEALMAAFQKVLAEQRLRILYLPEWKEDITHDTGR